MVAILVVDDHATDRQLLVTMLEFGGYEALTAESGYEALATLRSHKPALVICDMLMPRMDGYEFARELRGDPEIAQTPLIFYSATYDTGELEQLGQACGAARVLEKPQEPAVILAVVADVLGSAGDRADVDDRVVKDGSVDHESAGPGS